MAVQSRMTMRCDVVQSPLLDVKLSLVATWPDKRLS